MIKILIIALITISLYGYTAVNQNMKALYKGIELTETQEDYILDNQDKNLDILNKILKKEVRQLKEKHLNDKNVIEFMFNSDGTIDKIKFLKKSNSRKIDKATKRVIKKAIATMNKPEENTPIRFIFIYKVGQRDYDNPSNYNNSTGTTASETYYQTISNGTTRFQHSSEEYARVFETSRDGFVNLSVNPQLCMERATLLTENGQRIKIVGMYGMYLNQEVLKGKYKLLLKTKKTCNVNLQYP